jgi:hypothetical protein
MIACGLGLLVIGAGQATAGLLDATIQGQYYYPNLTTPLGSAVTEVVNPDAVFHFSGAGSVSFDLSDTKLQVSFNGVASAATFNGAVFTVESGGSPITGVSIDSNSTVLNFDLSRVAFTSTTISENIQGLDFTSGKITLLDISFGSAPAVPEPSTFALLGLGGIGLAIGAYRRRQMTAV